MVQQKALIAGCGDIGGALALQLLAAGWRVWGLRRRVEKLPAGVAPLAADLTRGRDLAQLPAVDVVFYTASAGARDENAYQRAYVDGVVNLLRALKRNPPRRFFFVSSSGVYHQSDGSWVDETSPTNPTRFNGRILLQGEARARAGGIAATVVRFSGIYGPGRTRMIRAVLSGAQPRADVFSNRIHRDDCAGVLLHLAGLPQAEPLYLASDHEPARLSTIIAWLKQAAAAAGIGAPADQAVLSLPARGDKRCRNTRLLASGYQFRYPNFREGYRALLEEMRVDGRKQHQ